MFNERLPQNSASPQLGALFKNPVLKERLGAYSSKYGSHLAR